MAGAVGGGLSRLFFANMERGKGKEKVEEDHLELHEDDIWNTLEGGSGSSSSRANSDSRKVTPIFLGGSTSSAPPFAWRVPPIPRLIISGASSGGCRQEPVVEPQYPHRSSAPVPFPKINLRVNYPRNELMIGDAETLAAARAGTNFFDVVELEPEDEEGEFIPPHEILARRYSRKRCICHSMFEGIGRTLKGRDLIILRNAILLKTGYIEME